MSALSSAHALEFFAAGVLGAVLLKPRGSMIHDERDNFM